MTILSLQLTGMYSAFAQFRCRQFDATPHGLLAGLSVPASDGGRVSVFSNSGLSTISFVLRHFRMAIVAVYSLSTRAHSQKRKLKCFV